MEEWSIDTEIINTVNEQIDGIFTKLGKLYDLHYGDITPEQANHIEVVKETLIGIADEYTRQNRAAA